MEIFADDIITDSETDSENSEDFFSRGTKSVVENGKGKEKNKRENKFDLKLVDQVDSGENSAVKEQRKNKAEEILPGKVAANQTEQFVASGNVKNKMQVFEAHSKSQIVVETGSGFPGNGSSVAQQQQRWASELVLENGDENEDFVVGNGESESNVENVSAQNFIDFSQWEEDDCPGLSESADFCLAGSVHFKINLDRLYEESNKQNREAKEKRKELDKKKKQNNDSDSSDDDSFFIFDFDDSIDRNSPTHGLNHSSNNTPNSLNNSLTNSHNDNNKLNGNNHKTNPDTASLSENLGGRAPPVKKGKKSVNKESRRGGKGKKKRTKTSGKGKMKKESNELRKREELVAFSTFLKSKKQSYYNICNKEGWKKAQTPPNPRKGTILLNRERRKTRSLNCTNLSMELIVDIIQEESFDDFKKISNEISISTDANLQLGQSLFCATSDPTILAGKDYEQWLKTVNKALQQAMLYTVGHRAMGIKQSDKKAYDYFNEAHELGHPRGTYKIAEAHYLGNVVEKNVVKAQQLWKLSLDIFLACTQSDEEYFGDFTRLYIADMRKGIRDFPDFKCILLDYVWRSDLLRSVITKRAKKTPPDQPNTNVNALSWSNLKKKQNLDKGRTWQY